MSTPSLFKKEIEEQPEALRRLLGIGRSKAEEISEAVDAFSPTFVLIAARGSSDNAARYAQYLFGVHHRWPVALATPSLFTTYRTPPKVDRAWVVGISQSGESPDVVGVLSEARRQGALTLALTNAEDSPLGRAAQWVLPLCAGEERAVAASKTYLNQLMALALLSTALAPAPERWTALYDLPGWANATLGLNPGLEQGVVPFHSVRSALVLARGFNYATAHEVALKLKETGKLFADPHSYADFLHGPSALLEPELPTLLIAPTSATDGDLGPLLSLLDGRGARKVIISDRPELLEEAELPLPLPPGVPEWLSPLVATIPGQLFAEALSRGRGLDPDRPPGLAKVTRTL